MVDSPQVRKRQDFKNVDDHVKHLEDIVQYKALKESLEKLKRDIDSKSDSNINSLEQSNDNGSDPIDNVSYDEQSKDNNDENFDNDSHYEAEYIEETNSSPDEDFGFNFIKGYSNANNPGKLIIGKNQRFTCSKIKRKEDCFIYYYECATKPENKGNSKAQCKAPVKVITDSDGNNISIEKFPKLTDHSHICDESRVIKWRIMLDLENEYCKDTVILPSIVHKKNHFEIY